MLVLSLCKNNISMWRAKIIRQRVHKFTSRLNNGPLHFPLLFTLRALQFRNLQFIYTNRFNQYLLSLQSRQGVA